MTTAKFESRTYEVAYALRPISDRTAFLGRPTSGDRDPFRKSSWGGESGTQALLARELYMLNARQTVLEMDVKERDIRVDGGLRADARLASTAVRLLFVTDDGPLVFATDRYGYDYRDNPKTLGWQDNVRAIALGLEALRKVDRYGITQSREQYRGFLALEGGTGTKPSGMTTDLALDVIARESGRMPGYVQANLGESVKLARIGAHPDRNHGQEERWRGVDAAVTVLQRNGML